ncbi:hypothetical protein, partial [Actinacidiphila glaucinigra]|uniref:hypothetical protein n=1 Tax=Actinacidiphila glaucinigra TaxID=235986 RepID=UPI00366B9AC9
EEAAAVLTVLPAPGDRGAIEAAAYRAAANYVRGNSADERYGKASISTAMCTVADELYRWAAAAASGSGRVADETQADFQDRGEAARQAAGIDGTAGDAQDVAHAFVLDEPTGGCLLCGLSPTYRKHEPAVVSQPGREE